jgi:hypothetical protein
VRTLFRVESTTVPDLPLADAGWEDDETRPRSAPEIVDALEQTWTMIDECLRRWTRSLGPPRPMQCDGCREPLQVCLPDLLKTHVVGGFLYNLGRYQDLRRLGHT